ncbi:hypothetical protein HK405_010679, partial [Cladochytrium tenue]
RIDAWARQLLWCGYGVHAGLCALSLALHPTTAGYSGDNSENGDSSSSSTGGDYLAPAVSAAQLLFAAAYGPAAQSAARLFAAAGTLAVMAALGVVVVGAAAGPTAASRSTPASGTGGVERRRGWRDGGSARGGPWVTEGIRWWRRRRGRARSILAVLSLLCTGTSYVLTGVIARVDDRLYESQAQPYGGFYGDVEWYKNPALQQPATTSLSAPTAASTAAAAASPLFMTDGTSPDWLAVDPTAVRADLDLWAASNGARGVLGVLGWVCACAGALVAAGQKRRSGAGAGAGGMGGGGRTAGKGRSVVGGPNNAERALGNIAAASAGAAARSA